MPPIPKPPVKTMADFIVFSFVTIIVVMIFVAMVGTVVVAVVAPERDLSGIIKALSGVLASLVSALIGYLAGKGEGRSEMHDEISQMGEPSPPPHASAEPPHTTEPSDL